MISLLLASFFSGIFSVLAPCVVALLPVLLAADPNTKRRHHRPLVVIGSLLLSIIVFSILLKSTTALLFIPNSIWSIISGSIVLAFGLITLFPRLWNVVAQRSGLAITAQKVSTQASIKRGVIGDVFLGASLGPIFSACSPTYALIVAVLLPASFSEGVVYLCVFCFGLGIALLAITLGGQRLVKSFGWSINPEGWFKRSLGVVLIVIGIAIATGIDKQVLEILVQNGLYDWQINIESIFTS